MKDKYIYFPNNVNTYGYPMITVTVKYLSKDTQKETIENVKKTKKFLLGPKKSRWQ